MEKVVETFTKVIGSLFFLLTPHVHGHTSILVDLENRGIIYYFIHQHYLPTKERKHHRSIVFYF